MNKKSIAILVVITLLVVVIAILLEQRRQAATSNDVYGAAFFRGLVQKLNDIALVEIVQGKSKVTLQRDGEIWRINEKGGYAADFDKLQPVVLSIANLQSIEAKTSKVDQYERIGVEDPSADDATHAGVTLKDANGGVLASLVLGNMLESEGGAKKQMYVRRLNESQAWLVEGHVEVAVESSAWIKKDKVLDIYRTRIKSFSIALPEGDRYLLVRDTADSKDFKYLPPPGNAKIRSFARLDDMSAALENVVPDDVLVASSIDLSTAEAARVEYKTFDGLVVVAQLIKKDGRWYVKYSSQFEPMAGAKVVPSGASAESVTDAKLKQEAEDLAKKLAPWVFILPDAKVALMIRKSNDVLVQVGK